MSTILVDVDGVLADFTGHLLNTIRNRHPDMVMQLSDIRDWDIFDHLKEAYGPAVKKTATSICDDDARLFWATIPIIPGSKSALTLLRDAGHKVVAVTAPWHGCVHWAHTRTSWLTRNMGFQPSEIIIASQKYHIRGDVLIDDKPEHVTAWSEVHRQGVAYLFTAPYNEDFSWRRRFNGWSEWQILDRKPTSRGESA